MLETKEGKRLDDALPIQVKHLCVRTKDYNILENVNLSAYAGEVQALMGPSGSGKTTLLNFIAGRDVGAQVKGFILVKNRPATNLWLASHITTVSQHDHLLATATPRETLTFTARLTHKGATPKEIEKKVDDVLEEMNLSHRADCYIGGGGSTIMGLSGGEMRRVTVGEQLVKDPKILLLDEPTSSLDSTLALNLVKTLKKIAKKGRIVIMSIHRPSSQINDLIDRFTLMSHGRLICNSKRDYFHQFFEGAGHVCPKFYNPTDFYLDVISNKRNARKLSFAFAALRTMPKTPVDRPSAGKRWQIKPNISRVVKLSINNASPGSSEEQYLGKPLTMEAPKTSWCEQFRCLAERRITQWFRDPYMFRAETFQYIGAALLIAAPSYQVDNATDVGTLQRIGAFGLCLTFLSFIAAFTIICKFDEDRKFLKKDLSSRLYNVSSFFAALTVTSWMIEGLFTILYGIIIYFIVGLRLDDDGKHVFLNLLALIQYALFSETLGVLCAVAAPNAMIGLLIHSPMCVVMFSLSGFLNPEKLPIILGWTTHVNPLYYTLVAIVRNEFVGFGFKATGDGFGPNTNEVFDGETQIYPSLNNGLNYEQNVLTVLSFLVFSRLMLLFLMLWYHGSTTKVMKVDRNEYKLADWVRTVERQRRNVKKLKRRVMRRMSTSYKETESEIELVKYTLDAMSDPKNLGPKVHSSVNTPNKTTIIEDSKSVLLDDDSKSEKSGRSEGAEQLAGIKLTTPRRPGWSHAQQEGKGVDILYVRDDGKMCLNIPNESKFAIPSVTTSREPSQMPSRLQSRRISRHTSLAEGFKRSFNASDRQKQTSSHGEVGPSVQDRPLLDQEMIASLPQMQPGGFSITTFAAMDQPSSVENKFRQISPVDNAPSSRLVAVANKEKLRVPSAVSLSSRRRASESGYSNDNVDNDADEDQLDDSLKNKEMSIDIKVVE
mmetsp:Transcript_7623/g.11541  ORF Transcript_7623/g.11541 Transcript_7623/m.11541 type:complete len:943 (+) Transcript_7623:143-2971(+)